MTSEETNPRLLPAETKAPVAADAGSVKELLRVALPLVISSGSLSLMSAADRMILTGYSADALAAVTPASMMHWTVACVPLGTILYANTFIAQFEGAGRRDRMMASLWQAIWLAVICGLLLIGLIPFSRSLLQLTRQPESVIEQEAIFFNTLCGGSVFLLLSMALSCYFSGRQRTAVVMLANLTSVVLNFVLAWLLVFGIGPLPEMGIQGAALAIIFARCGDIVIYLTLIWREQSQIARQREQDENDVPRDQPTPRESLWSFWKPETRLLGQYLRYGVPSGLHYFVDNSGFTSFLLIVGSLGRDALAATNLAFSVNGLIFVPLLGFGTAVQTVVGHHMGANRIPAATRTTWNAATLGIVWTGLAGLLLVLIPDITLKPFSAFSSSQPASETSLATLTPTIVLLLRFVAVYSIFDALAVVFSSALRGAGDTVFPMLLTMFSSWFVMVAPAMWLVNHNSATLVTLWVTCSAHISLTGGFMLLRFLAGRWKSIHLVEEDKVT